MQKEGIDDQFGPKKGGDDLLFEGRSQSSRFNRILQSDVNPVEDAA